MRTAAHVRRAASVAALAAVVLLGCGTSASPGPADAASRLDANSGSDAVAVDQHAADGNPLPADASSGCPASCPSGQIIVNWSEASPGFPGPSGCDCEPNPCDGGGTACDALSACQAAHHGGGCDGWNGGTLDCFQCG